MINRLSKVPDFPLILERLKVESISSHKLSPILKKDRRTLDQIRDESLDVPKEWLSCWYLLDIYVRKVGTPVPLIGDNLE